MTNHQRRGRGIDVVGPDEVLDGVVAGTASDPWIDEIDETTPPAPTSGNGGSSGSKAETVKELSAQVGQQAAETGQHVASLAKDEAQSVVSEATEKARDLLGETKTQLHDQLSAQQSALATMLRSLADELHDMAEHSASERSSLSAGDETGSQSSAHGIAGETVRKLSDRASGVASWLEQREPGDVLDDVTGFARRRPGLFLALAGAAGLVTARFTRGLAGAGQDHNGTSAKPSTQAHIGLGDSAGSKYPSRSEPVVPVIAYADSTPTGPSAREAVSGGAEWQWGNAHD